jgi:chromate reductase
VAGLCGSLRAASINRKLLVEAGELMPEGMSLHILSFEEVPIYSADTQEQGFPDVVVALGAALAQADALLVASPEYNFSIPGGLKNALDWVSRLPDQPLKGKPVALMGASPGPVGTARMQYDLRKVFHFMEAHVLLKPEIFFGNAGSRLDEKGRLVDPVTRKFIADQMLALQKWTRAVDAMRSTN